jgi:hypothetical protein
MAAQSPCRLRQLGKADLAHTCLPRNFWLTADLLSKSGEANDLDRGGTALGDWMSGP